MSFMVKPDVVIIFLTINTLHFGTKLDLPQVNSFMKKGVCILITYFSFLAVHCQDKQARKEFIISEDNDFLNFRGEGTDRGYTNGMHFEILTTQIRKKVFTDKLLIHLTNESNKSYSWALTQLMFTPCNIETNKIQVNDRPYAGVLYVSRSLYSVSNTRKEKLSSSISLGSIGRYSFARETQIWVHKLIHYDKPEGWNNQIRPDLIIDYSINYEKLVASPSKNFELIANAGGSAGTLQNDLLFGIQFRAGLLNDYFSALQGLSEGKTKIFFYMKTNVVFVMDNATLQGGFFTHRSPYVIPKDSINRAQFVYEYGLAIEGRIIGVHVSEQVRSQEFKRTYAQQIGNITLYLKI